MVEYIIACGLCAFAGGSVGYLLGVIKTRLEPQGKYGVDLNNFLKAASKRENILEFLAPGEMSETVLVYPIHQKIPLDTDRGCNGCKYAGRYLIPNG